jgi:hypothetical protein
MRSIKTRRRRRVTLGKLEPFGVIHASGGAERTSLKRLLQTVEAVAIEKTRFLFFS